MGKVSEKFIPLFLLHAADVAEEKGIGRLERTADHGHARLFRGIVTLFCIAPFALCHQVQPGMRAAPRTWDHMVQRKFSFGAAILAFKTVALEDILTGKTHPLIGSIDITIEADHGRHGKTPGDAADLVAVAGPNHFALVQVYQDKSTLYRTHHQRAKVLIQYQYSTLHGEKI